MAHDTLSAYPLARTLWSVEVSIAALLLWEAKNGAICSASNVSPASVRLLLVLLALQKLHNGLWLLVGREFTSATSFSIHCKRQQTPNKQGDDGESSWSITCLLPQ